MVQTIKNTMKIQKCCLNKKRWTVWFLLRKFLPISSNETLLKINITSNIIICFVLHYKTYYNSLQFRQI